MSAVAFIGTCLVVVWLLWAEELSLPGWLDLVLWPFLGFGTVFLMWSALGVFRALGAASRYLSGAVWFRGKTRRRKP